MFKKRNAKIVPSSSSRIDKDETAWADKDGVPILFYAVLQNKVGIVRKLLNSKLCTKSRLNIPIFEDGIVEFGIPAKASTLLAAMAFACVEIVEMLLNKGADPYIVDKSGIDSLMFASTLGRAENVTFWLSRFPDWDVNRGNIMNGATALHCAVFFGRNKMKTFQALLRPTKQSQCSKRIAHIHTHTHKHFFLLKSLQKVEQK